MASTSPAPPPAGSPWSRSSSCRRRCTRSFRTGRPRWEHIDDRTARVHLTVGEHELAPEIQVAPNGHLLRIEMMRWDPEGPSGKPEEVRWVVDGFGDEETFGGYTFPASFRVTKNAGTPHLDTFFEGEVTSADYEPGPPEPEEEEEEEREDENERDESPDEAKHGEGEGGDAGGSDDGGSDD